MVRLKKHLIGTTLIESVIAMSLITIVFVVCIKVFDYSINADPFALKQRAANVCDSLMTNIKLERFFVNEEVFVDGLNYETSFEGYEDFRGIIKVNIRGYDSDAKLLYELKELVYAK